jgi:CheY-like chemotaxis protein
MSESERRAASILLVEDNPHDVRLTRIALEEAGTACTLEVARDGDEALAHLRRPGARRPDLVLLDLNMPGKDGREVLREIKGDPGLRRIPVVVLTTSPSPGDVALAYDLHANAYLTKPMGIVELRSLVECLTNFWLRLNRAAPAA